MTEHEMSARDIAEQARRLADRAENRARETRPRRPLPRGLRDPAEAFQRRGITDPRAEPVALVLAGGGARGAYQAGVARFLAETGTPVTAVSGASIGALNGAILAAAPSLTAGAERMVEAWTYVAERTGRPPHRAALTDGEEVAPDLAERPVVDEPTRLQLLNLVSRMKGPLFGRDFLDGLLMRFVDLDDVQRGLPLLVSVFPSVDPSIGGIERFFRLPRKDGPDRAILHPRFGWALDVVRGWFLGAKAEWIRVNSQPKEFIHNTVLASAALPIVMPPRVVDGRVYRDGGIADNLPVGALAELVDVSRVVVVHLKPYPLFNPADPDFNLIEIMPSRPLNPGGPIGGLTGLVDLSPDRVAALCEAGYEDARDQLGRVWQHEGIARIAEFTADFRTGAIDELGEPR
ncbi:hypothetical protein ALI144C_19745 [Actinosynnema sp. ALI-1.44]|uniref:patatin-like phospholipase family protein n=1 Tax=Actinosynnema sp. ALI-1.44 TaxID=1933779 RepID=UPI00097C6D8E|nr:patatin-like phospholipase family protein [Actinosynnema sp. ALI-1.44]ONI81549.1 hypothetical protein ALI144C_19745 [Actinosynnema sp. ALI-1.44]